MTAGRIKNIIYLSRTYFNWLFNSNNRKCCEIQRFFFSFSR